MTALPAVAFSLMRSGLFNALLPEQFEELLRKVALVELESGAALFEEGDAADALYVVFKGSVQIVTTTDDGQPIVLSRLAAGAHFGEQALLGPKRVRSASVRAAENSVLVQIAKSDFDRLLASTPELSAQLEELGRLQRDEKLSRRTELVRALLAADDVDATTVQFRAGEVLFRQGEAAEAAYVVLTGSIGIYVDREGVPVWLSSLGPGACVGELGVITASVRSATAIASERSTALRITAQRFAAAVQRSPELSAHLATLGRVYALPQRGYVTQHTGRLQDADCVTQLYHLADGRRIAVWHLVGESGLRLEASNTVAARRISSPADRLTLGLTADGRIASLDARGSVPGLPHWVRRAIDGESLTPSEEQALREGVEPGQQEAELVCRCLRVRRDTLKRLVRSGASDLRRLQEQSGCGTVCGSCLPAVEELLGGTGFLPVRLALIRDVAAQVKAFSLESADGQPLPASLPGQHVVLRASVRGRVLDRPYTLSSPAGAAWEVMVQREPQGAFSAWLFEATPGTQLDASAPRGDFVWELGPPPVVCLVAGIGVTPALAFLRTLADQGLPHRLVVDWSARSEADFACLDEVLASTRRRGNLTLQRRVTSREPRLSRTDALGWFDRFPTALFFVCGPESFNAEVTTWLSRAGVHPSRVRVEEFTPVGALPPPSRAAPHRMALSEALERGVVST